MTDSLKRELHEEHPDPEADRRQKRHRGHGEHDSLAIRSHGQKRFKYEDYTVGIICALEFEMSAVRFMLDNEHPNLNFEHDQNLYVLGELGKLNVVIACLPGNQGKRGCSNSHYKHGTHISGNQITSNGWDWRWCAQRQA